MFAFKRPEEGLQLEEGATVRAAPAPAAQQADGRAQGEGELSPHSSLSRGWEVHHQETRR